MKRECFFVNPNGEAVKGEIDIKISDQDMFLDRKRRFISNEKGEIRIEKAAEGVIDDLKKRSEKMLKKRV